VLTRAASSVMVRDEADGQSRFVTVATQVALRFLFAVAIAISPLGMVLRGQNMLSMHGHFEMPMHERALHVPRRWYVTIAEQIIAMSELLG
ncbi:hypothetical protein K4M05_20265, partial [Pseudomonas syringae pv. tomato]